MASLGRNLSVMTQVRRINRQLMKTVELCAEAVESTLLTQAALLASEQRSLAPIDETSDTPGALRDSIQVVRGQPTAKKAFVVKITAGGRATLKQGAGSKPYDYARAVEFGTQDMQPRPFFFPIYRARRKAIKAAVKKQIRNSVRKVFK